MFQFPCILCNVVIDRIKHNELKSYRSIVTDWLIEVVYRNMDIQCRPVARYSNTQFSYLNALCSTESMTPAIYSQLTTCKVAYS